MDHRFRAPAMGLALACVLALTGCGVVDDAVGQIAGMVSDDEESVVEEESTPVAETDDENVEELDQTEVQDDVGSDPSDDEADEPTDATEDSPADLDVTPLRDLTGAQLGEPMRVTYQFSGPMAEMMDQMTISMDGNRLAFSGSGDQGDMYWSQVDGDLVMCFNEGGWECLLMPIDDPGMMGTDQLFGADLFTSIPDFDADQTHDVRADTILGRSATCVTADEAEGAVEFCFDQATGMMLSGSVIDGGDPFDILAVDVSRPDEQDFVPPATPMDLGQLLNE